MAILELKPFSLTFANNIKKIQIKTHTLKKDHEIIISWELSGPIDEFMNFPTLLPPSKGTELWNDTCLEIFLSPENSKHYYEIHWNFAGQYNCYSLAHYRGPLNETSNLDIQLLAPPKLMLASEDNKLMQIRHKIQLHDDKLRSSKWTYSTCAVIKTKLGELTYWAPRHVDKQPNFHMPKSFYNL